MGVREIIFRGKDAHGEWVEGSLITKYDCDATITSSAYILEKCEFSIGCDWNTSIYDCEFIEVDLDTLGQYTGLTDKNGTKIFEGDIVRGVYIKTGGEVFVISGAIKYALDRFQIWGKYVVDLRDVQDVKVIGNIYDNSELLGGDNGSMGN